MAPKRASDQDRLDAIERVMSGLKQGDDVITIADAVADLHPKNNTFPGEVFMSLAVDALNLAGVSQDTPIEHDGLLDRHLPERRFRGRENSKIKFALLATAALNGGLNVDLLDEIVWWRTDDYWVYALCASVALIRAAAEHAGSSVPEFVDAIAQCHNGSVGQP